MIVAHERHQALAVAERNGAKADDVVNCDHLISTKRYGSRR
jgi:hypothetical protein